MKKHRILIADDQQDVLDTLEITLKNENWDCALATSPQEVIAALKGQEFDLLLMDLNYQRDTTSGQEGLELLEAVHKLENAPPVVVMTAWGSVELAVSALHKGAKDFVEKPWDNLRLLNILDAQVRIGSSEKQSQLLAAKNQLLQSQQSSDFIIQSPQMLTLLETLKSVADSDASVLLVGENGTGKNQLAAMLHQYSARSGQQLVTMDLGAITETLFESELFGHNKGAFTDAKELKIGRLELANHGTLFLDEVANISSQQQTRLLRVLETGEYERVGSSQTRKTDVRFVSATNANLEEAITNGEFRQDLFYRLNTVTLKVPALRERPDDILPLAQHFLAKFAQRYKKANIKLSVGAIQALMQHDWPGNVRELAHCIERAVLVTKGVELRAESLALQGQFASGQAQQVETQAQDKPDTLENMERKLILSTLAYCQHNISQCAKSLQISRSALYRKLDAYEIKVE